MVHYLLNISNISFFFESFVSSLQPITHAFIKNFQIDDFLSLFERSAGGNLLNSPSCIIAISPQNVEEPKSFWNKYFLIAAGGTLLGLCVLWGLTVYFEKNSQPKFLEEKIAKNLEEIQKLVLENRNAKELLSKTTANLNVEILEKHNLVDKIAKLASENELLVEKAAQVIQENISLGAQNNSLETEKVKALERVDELERDVTNLQEEATNLQEGITNLQEEAANLREEAANLQFHFTNSIKLLHKTYVETRSEMPAPTTEDFQSMLVAIQFYNDNFA